MCASNESATNSLGTLSNYDDLSSNHGALETKIKQRFGSIYKELFVLSNGHYRVSDFDEDSFQRFHWGIYDGYDSDEYFNSLDTLKNRLRERYRNGDYETVQAEIDEYTQNLREAASAFAALFSPSQRPPEVESALNQLLSLGRVANILPVLMAAQMEYGDDEPEKMVDIIKSCETLAFRMYATDGRRSDTGRGKLVRLAHAIHSDESYVFEDAVSRLDNITRIYTDDDRFERLLREPDFYEMMSSQDIRYLFYHYGQNLDVEVHEDVQRDLDQILSTAFEVEHILARKLPEEDIPDDLKEEFDEHIHRLGNLTVASEYWNKNYGNLPFDEKKVASDGREAEYQSSNLQVQRNLAEYDEFGRKEIDEREQKIVEFALEEWAISQAQPTDSQAESSGDTEYDSLPDNFFRRLTNRQEAVVRILLDEGDWMLNEDIRERMEDEYDLSTSGGTAMSGILAGFTRKYSKNFTYSLIDYEWLGDQMQYRLHLDSGFIEELRERFDSENR
jgi:hypothetical protein